MSKYLAIDGWSEFQPLRGRGEWIKDSTIQQDKDKLRGLSFFQRGLLQELRRVRGRIGKNIPYELEYILSATHTTRTDRPHVPHALSTLISRGLLVVTDQQIDAPKAPEKEIENESKKEKKKTSCVAASAPQKQEPLTAVLYMPLNGGEEFAISEADFKLWKETYPAVDVMQQLRAMVAWCHANSTRKKTKQGVKRFINSWLARAQDNPKAAEEFRKVSGNGNSKAQERHERNDEKYRRVLGRLSAGAGGNLSLGNDGRGVSGLPGITLQIPIGGSERGRAAVDGEADRGLERDTEVAGLHPQDP